MSTRPLNPHHRAVLSQLAELGPSPFTVLRDADGKAPDGIAYLAEVHWIEIEHGAKRGRNIYRITQWGRNVLACGYVTGQTMGARNKDKVNRSFTLTGSPRKAKKDAGGCVHHFDVGSDIRQHHKCRLCDLEFDLPLTMGLELRPVGEHRVRNSERFAEAWG